MVSGADRIGNEYRYKQVYLMKQGEVLMLACELGGWSKVSTECDRRKTSSSCSSGDREWQWRTYSDCVDSCTGKDVTAGLQRVNPV